MAHRYMNTNNAICRVLSNHEHALLAPQCALGAKTAWVNISPLLVSKIVQGTNVYQYS